MSCRPNENNKSGDPATDASRCRCYGAVMKAYDAMKDGHPEKEAKDVALRVYRHHHPEDCKTLAELTVDRWLHSGALH